MTRASQPCRECLFAPKPTTTLLPTEGNLLPCPRAHYDWSQCHLQG